MYKNKEAQKEANRLANQRYRAKGITEEGITQPKPEGITGLVQDEQGYWYAELKAGLSGQRWYPGRNGYHPADCVCGIRHQPSFYPNGSHYDPRLDWDGE